MEGKEFWEQDYIHEPVPKYECSASRSDNESDESIDEKDRTPAESWESSEEEESTYSFIIEEKTEIGQQVRLTPAVLNEKEKKMLVTQARCELMEAMSEEMKKKIIYTAAFIKKMEAEALQKLKTNSIVYTIKRTFKSEEGEVMTELWSSSEFQF